MKSLIFLFFLLLLVVSINPTNENYLYPVRGEHCELQGLKKTSGPTMCILEDGTFNPHSNCRCVSPITGFCKECYPPEKKRFATLINP